MVMVPGLPMVKDPQEIVDARGMVANVSLADRLPTILPLMEALRLTVLVPVSYTHLDVYKRQLLGEATAVAEGKAPTPPRRAHGTLQSAGMKVS